MISPVTKPATVLFVAGPADGQLRQMHATPQFYRVALEPEVERMSVYGDGSPEQVVLSPRHFEYIHMRIAGHIFYVPEDWQRGPYDIYERVITALQRGYVGRPS